MNFQTWICPKCHDDHRQDGPCSPSSSEMFMPAQEDRTYIAEQYRLRRSDLAAAQARVQTLERTLSDTAMLYREVDGERNALRTERDQLRAELERVKDVKSSLAEQNVEQSLELGRVQRALTASQAEVARLTKERDERDDLTKAFGEATEEAVAEHLRAGRPVPIHRYGINLFLIPAAALTTQGAQLATLRAAVENYTTCVHVGLACAAECGRYARDALSATSEPAILQAVRKLKDALDDCVHTLTECRDRKCDKAWARGSIDLATSALRDVAPWLGEGGGG